ncbi:NAD-dependent epimerase/dehydratase family protein [Deltaproteobacteria bacterium TL4]
MQKALLKNCLVTGGAGFLGRNLVKALLKQGCHVRVFDLVEPDFSHKNLESIEGDLRNSDEVYTVCEGMDTVFHTAAIISLMGGSGVTEEYRKRAYAINVEGTKNVIKGCQKAGVSRLIYTSSVNVCFNGTPNPNMDENTSYATQVSDLYTETKIAIEPVVLEANGVDQLLTCVIRPSGIYGPEPNYMLDKVVQQLANGTLIAALGNPSSVQDNTHVDNLVHGEILAAQHLVPGGTACGKVYFIHDDEPQNYFEFFRPLIEGLGYPFPKVWIPGMPVKKAMELWQWLHFKFGILPPLISPKEVDKASVTCYSNLKAARRDLGYEPIITVKEAMKSIIPFYKSRLAEFKTQKM